MVTITQFTPRAYVKTLKRTDWTIAFNVSSMPTMTHSQTKPRAPGRPGTKGGQCNQGKECRYQVAKSDHRSEFRGHTGGDRARTQDRAADRAKCMDPEQRHQRQLHWQSRQPWRHVPECDERIRHQTQSELNPEEHNRLHGPSSRFTQQSTWRAARGSVARTNRRQEPEYALAIVWLQAQPQIANPATT